jgi:hypothetical protein
MFATPAVAWSTSRLIARSRFACDSAKPLRSSSDTPQSSVEQHFSMMASIFFCGTPVGVACELTTQRPLNERSTLFVE